MKFFAAFVLFTAVVMVTVNAYVATVPKLNPNGPKSPTFPGQGPFNPNLNRPRSRRSPQNNGQISVNGQKEGGTWNVEAQQKIWENKYGSIHVSGGANKQPGGKPQGQVGIGGSFHWG